MISKQFTLGTQVVDGLDQIDQVLWIIQVGDRITRLRQDLSKDATAHATATFTQINQHQCGVV
jgi:hypothetical protein